MLVNGLTSETFAPLYLRFSGQAGWLAVVVGAGMSHEYSYLFRTDDFGLSWEWLIGPDSYASGNFQICCKTGMAFLDGGTGLVTYTAGPNEGVLVDWTDDGGGTWESQPLPAPTGLDAVDFNGIGCSTHSPMLFSPRSGLVALECRLEGGEAAGVSGSTSFIYRTEDVGASWQSMPSPGGALQVFNDRVGLALGRDLYLTRDGGESWTKIKSVNWDGQFSFVDEDLGWAVARSGDAIALVRTADGGRSWSELQPKTTLGFVLTRVQMVDASTGWAEADRRTQAGSLILRTADGGSTWTDVTPPIPAPSFLQPSGLGKAIFLDSERAWVQSYGWQPYGDDSLSYLLWYTSDGGQSWDQRTRPTLYGDYTVLHFIDDRHGWEMSEEYAGAGSSWFTLLSTRDGARSWSTLLDDAYAHYELSADMAFFNSRTGLMALPIDSRRDISRPFVKWTHDGGATWEEQFLPPPAENPSLFEAEGLEIFCGTSSPRLYSIRSAVVEMTCEDYQYEPAGSFLYTTTDAGRNWLSMPFPGGSTMFLNAEVGLALGSEIYRTGNGGKTWIRTGSAPGDGSLSFVDENQGWALVRIDDSVTLLRTADGGRTWQELQRAAYRPIRMEEIHMVDAVEGWGFGLDQEHRRRVVRTGDGGSTWSDVTPSISTAAQGGSLGQTRGAFFLDELRAWLLAGSAGDRPGQLVLWRTTDGGRSWASSTVLEADSIGQTILLRFESEVYGWLIFNYSAYGDSYGAEPMTILRTRDGGQTWESLLQVDPSDLGDLPYGGISDLDFADANLGVATIDYGFSTMPSVSWTEDGGIGWTRQELPAPETDPEVFQRSDCRTVSPRFLTVQMVIVTVECHESISLGRVQERSFTYLTEDGGNSWQAFAFPGDQEPQWINPELGWATAGWPPDFDIYQTLEGGRSWTKISRVAWYGEVSFADEQTGWAVTRTEQGALVGLLKTQDGGRTWFELHPEFAQ
jgi:photosystem II stability/assembly factor-like uncharacterized protein